MKLKDCILRKLKKLLGIKSPSGMFDGYRYNKEFWKFVEIDLWEEWGLMPSPMSSDDALDILVSYLLGEDWCVVSSMNPKQANHEAVIAILKKHSKQFRKDIAHYCEKAEEENE